MHRYFVGDFTGAIITIASAVFKSTTERVHVQCKYCIVYIFKTKIQLNDLWIKLVWVTYPGVKYKQQKDQISIKTPNIPNPSVRNKKREKKWKSKNHRETKQENIKPQREKND